MATSRTDYSRKIDYSAVKDAQASMRRALVRFIGGIQGPRQKPVTAKQVLAWFHGTSWEFVTEALLDAEAAGEIEFSVDSLTGERTQAGTYTVVDKAEEGKE